jgi:hypothetical protein
MRIAFRTSLRETRILSLSDLIVEVVKEKLTT